MQPLLLGTIRSGEIDRIVDDCLAQVLKADPRPNLGFVYATDPLAPRLPELVARLQEHSGIRDWVGTVGTGICTTGQEHYDVPAVGVLTGHFPADSFRILPSLRTDVGGFVDRHEAWLSRHPYHVGVLHGDPTVAEIPLALAVLSREVPGAFFAGGLTSSTGIQQQVCGEVASGGLSGIIFSPEVPVVVAHTQGCTPLVGKRHLVTRAERNVLVELDGRPALEVFKDDIGEVLAKDLQRASGYIFAGLPVHHSDTGDYLVRNLLGFDPARGLVAIDERVNRGDPVLFCRRDGNSARIDLVRMLAEVRQRLGNQKPRGALYYSCLARGRHQFGENSEELRTIRDELGDLPLTGFFANGEIYQSRLYGYTGVLAVFL